MIIEIPLWSSHHNQLLYSAFYYCRQHRLPLQIIENTQIAANGATLKWRGKTCFFDYSDDTLLIGDPCKYDVYFKRSLLPINHTLNVIPLNFQVNLSYKSLQLLKYFKFSFLSSPKNKIEIVRALDILSLFTNLSHHSMEIRQLPKTTTDNGGKVIYLTRLWNPARTSNAAEKERRTKQNEFRINACRIIKANFPDSVAGIFPDEYALQMAPDVVIDKRLTSKQHYLKLLRRSDICIADDGLKDTPGWKIGEYALFGKSIITTPINTVAENFVENTNYFSTKDRQAYRVLPDLIHSLQRQKRYLEMAHQNKVWSNEYLHPSGYFHRIIITLENYSSTQSSGLSK